MYTFVGLFGLFGLGTVACFLAAIWLADGRWGLTGVVCFLLFIGTVAIAGATSPAEAGSDR